MIKSSDCDKFEDMRGINQDLTFIDANKEFIKRDVDFKENQMRTLNLIDGDAVYSNVALLLSDQCPFTIKVATFQGNNQTIFKERREFNGSLFKQMNDIYEHIDNKNQIHSTINGLDRIDRRDYPEIVLKEALLNILVHRDYSFSASSLINIYDDRIEFISIGGLLSGIEIEDIMAGVSICRNQKLANVFYCLHLIEAYGTGLNKIFTAYENTNKKPIISTTKNTFKIILPNFNFMDEEISCIREMPIIYNTEEEIILNLINEKGYTTRLAIEKALNTSGSTAYRSIKRLIDDGKIRKTGKGKNIKYLMDPNKLGK